MALVMRMKETMLSLAAFEEFYEVHCTRHGTLQDCLDFGRMV